MKTDQDIWTIQAMKKFGGSFVEALAVACEKADAPNFYTLKKAFPEYWRKYELIGLDMSKSKGEDDGS